MAIGFENYVIFVIQNLNMKDIFQKLLDDFRNLPKTNLNPTFMDICQMGGDRFEERCSQILRFYLNPNGEHKLKGLVLNSLLELLGYTNSSFNRKNVKVLTEEMTDDRKFIDITVISDGFVIAIENKIGASLYNPLDSYVTYINQKYNNIPKKFFVVLSVRRITDTGEIQKMNDNGYLYINYQDLFFNVKKNLGLYVTDCDQSYFIFLLDFIRTIEKRYYNNNSEMKRFFYDNSETIEDLIKEFNKFNADRLQYQKENIADLKNRVIQKTNASWWVYDGWDLCTDFNAEANRLGIESSYGYGDFNDPLSDFNIYITVWDKKHFEPYEKTLKEVFPDCDIDYNAGGGSRIYLHLPVIKGNNHEEIVQKLAEYYSIIKGITDRIK